jgi:ankyrin repeat protein
MQACWFGQEALFRKRILDWLGVDLKDTPLVLSGKEFYDFRSVKYYFDSLKQKQFELLTDDDKFVVEKMHDAYAFIDNLLLYQLPYHTPLFKLLPTQSIIDTFPYAKAPVFETPASVPPLTPAIIYNHLWLIKKNDPDAFMNFLKEVDKIPFNLPPPTFLVESSDHSLGITKIDGEWKIFDQNSISSEKFYIPCTTENIINAFNFDNNITAESALFNITGFISPLIISQQQAAKTKAQLEQSPIHIQCVNTILDNDQYINEAGISSLWLAASHNQVDLAEKLLKKGASLYCDHPSSILHNAIESGNDKIVDLLLAYDMNTELLDNVGNTPLALAIYNGRRNIVDALIKKEADITVVNSHELTLLHLAALQGDPEVIKLLLSKELDITARDKAGFMPIHYAVRKGNWDAMLTLINADANIQEVTAREETLLHLAAREGHLAILKYLIEQKIPHNRMNINDESILHTAAQAGQQHIVEYLLEDYLPPSELESNSGTLNAWIDEYNKYGQTPLHLAAGEGHMELVKFLLSHKPKLTAHDHAGNTVLHQAAWSGNVPLVQFLLDQKMDSAVTNNIGETLVHTAAANDNVDMIRLLQQKQLNIFAQDLKKGTALHLAARYGNEDTVGFLLDEGLAIDAQDSTGKTPLHEAVSKGHLKVVQQLQAAGANLMLADAKGNLPLHLAACSGNLPMLQFFLDHNVSMDEKTSFNDTLLHLAAANSQPEVIGFLFRRNVDINALNQKNESALSLAAIKGNDEIATLLINKGVKVDLADNSQQTPLHKSVVKGHTTIAQLLVRNDAELNKKDNRGFTPLFYAALTGNEKLASWLTKEGANIDLATEAAKKDTLSAVQKNGKSAAAHILLTALAHKDCLSAKMVLELLLIKLQKMPSQTGKPYREAKTITDIKNFIIDTRTKAATHPNDKKSLWENALNSVFEELTSQTAKVAPTKRKNSYASLLQLLKPYIKTPPPSHQPSLPTV